MSEPGASILRLPSKTVEGWKDALLQNRAVRGVEPITRELLDVLMQTAPDGTVGVQRHQLFSWAEALRGAATRAEPSGEARLNAVADEMRAAMNANEAKSEAKAEALTSAAPSLAVPPSATTVPPVVYQASSSASSWASAAFGEGLMRFKVSSAVTLTPRRRK